MPKKPKIEQTPEPPKPPEQPPASTQALVPAVKLTKRGLASYQQKQYLQNLPANYETFWPALRLRCQEGNTKALELMARITGLVKDSGFSIQNNIIQANQNNEGNSRFSFEKLVRDLEARDKSAASNVIEIQAE